jgi:V8-like Glu-specific endopeptidase
VLVLVAAAVLPAAARAITYGQPDGNLHPMVGALVGTFSDGTYPYCSGTLISPSVFLTAAHCEEGSTVCVTFDAQYTSRSKLVCGQWHKHPNFAGTGEGEADDVAVVVFPKSLNGITPASLPPQGLLDQMKQDGTLADASFTSVGYGAFAPTNGPGGKTYTYPNARYFSTGLFSSLRPAYLDVSQNPVKGNGGTCYGDSGGPVFLGNSTTVVAITSTGDSVCRSTNVAQRADTPSVQAFLASFLAG